jgi:hypothetical protein
VAIAADPTVVQALHTFDVAALEQWRMTTRFDTVALYDGSGIVRVQASPVTNRNPNLGKDYSWRDYFRGARRLGEAGLRAGYISRALLSETENIWVFGIAAPVYDEGTWAGVLLITVGTDAALGQRRLDRASDDGPMAVIAAPRDRSRATTVGEGDYVVILHDGLTHGAGIAIDSPRLRELRATRTERNQLRWIDPDPITDDAHHDPVPDSTERSVGTCVTESPAMRCRRRSADRWAGLVAAPCACMASRDTVRVGIGRRPGPRDLRATTADVARAPARRGARADGQGPAFL